MQTAMSTGTKTSERPGITYRTVCQNPGCGAIFDLRIAPENASLLSGTMACPRCRRRGGMPQVTGRLASKPLPPNCLTGRPAWPPRGLTRKSRFSDYMNARARSLDNEEAGVLSQPRRGPRHLWPGTGRTPTRSGAARRRHCRGQSGAGIPAGISQRWLMTR